MYFFVNVLFLCFESAKKKLSYSIYLIILSLIQSQRSLPFIQLVVKIELSAVIGLISSESTPYYGTFGGQNLCLAEAKLKIAKQQQLAMKPAAVKNTVAHILSKNEVFLEYIAEVCQQKQSWYGRGIVYNSWKNFLFFSSSHGMT